MTAICVGMIAGCGEILPEKVQVIVNEKKEEVKDKAVSEFQKALSEQVQEFMSSNDLKKTLGLTDDEEKEVTNSFKEYLESYENDSEELKKAWDSLRTTIEELKEKGEFSGLSEEELNKKIENILNDKK